tara:strand:- start:44 stop:661 length:618 start_codon:yes stop_codon:yes gene_type:complete
MNIKEYWDYEMAVGRGYDKVRNGWSKQDFETRSDDTIATYLNLKKRYKVAEIGCAMAYACKNVAPKVKEYVGIDFSQAMLDEAKVLNKDFANAKFVNNDGLTIPIEDDYFDIVFCELCFQHMSEDQCRSNIAEINRVVKPDGGVALQFPMPRTADGFAPPIEFLKEAFPREQIKQYIHYIYVSTPDIVDSEIKQLVDDPAHCILF